MVERSTEPGRSFLLKEDGFWFLCIVVSLVLFGSKLLLEEIKLLKIKKES